MKIQSDDWRERRPIADAIRGTVHAVQFSETDGHLVQTLADHVAGAFAAGDHCHRRYHAEPTWPL